MQNEPRIIVWDIESTPLVSLTWGLWDQNVVHLQEDFSLLCFSWKVLGDKKTHWVGRPDFEKEYAKDPKNDFKVVESLHAVLSSADVTIAHNGDGFDLKKSAARMILNGFDPPTPSQSIDTLKIARQRFGFSSNKLDDLAQALKVGAKVKHPGIALWIGCMNGDPASWALMKKYNVQDTKILELVYLKLRPWIIGHPNLALLSDELAACPNCGSDSLTKQGFKSTKTMRYQQYRCGDCGAWSRARASEKGDKPMAVN